MAHQACPVLTRLDRTVVVAAREFQNTRRASSAAREAIRISRRTVLPITARPRRNWHSRRSSWIFIEWSICPVRCELVDLARLAELSVPSNYAERSNQRRHGVGYKGCFVHRIWKPISTHFGLLA